MLTGGAPYFDQRPGELDAARMVPASGLIICGARRDGGPWQVLCSVRGADGTCCQVPMSLAEARKAIAELSDMIEIIEGKEW